MNVKAFLPVFVVFLRINTIKQNIVLKAGKRLAKVSKVAA